jgi:hypothetical protein
LNRLEDRGVLSTKWVRDRREKDLDDGVGATRSESLMSSLCNAHWDLGVWEDLDTAAGVAHTMCLVISTG